MSVLIFGHKGNLLPESEPADDGVRGLEVKRSVHNLLRLMDESSGRESLINCNRKSVVIRNFVFK